MPRAKSAKPPPPSAASEQPQPAPEHGTVPAYPDLSPLPVQDLPPMGIDDMPPMASGAPQQSGNAPTPPIWDRQRADNPLYETERLLMQQLIRHGEKTIYMDEESGKRHSVAEFVANELKSDGLTLSTPLFARLFDELLQHLTDPGFVAERYFIAHADPEVSHLAADLVEEKYQLSKYHSKTQTVVDDVHRLADIVPHLLIDYKMAITEIELKRTLDQLRQPAVINDNAKCLEVMTRYKHLTILKQQMAKMLGDRVIG